MSDWLESLAPWQAGLLWVGVFLVGILALIGALVIGTAIHDEWERRSWAKAADEARKLEQARNQPAPRSGT